MTEFWRMGPSPVPARDIAQFARRLESMGWDGLAVGENHARTADPFTLLAASAVATTTLRLGTATLVPLRHPMLLANAMTVIQGISQGRCRFSIGRGDSAMKAFLRKPMPVGRFETYLSQVQAYLRREEVEIDGAVSTMARLAAVDPSLDVPKPPVDAAAAGTKMIEVGVKHADSISFAVGADLLRLQNRIDLVKQLCQKVGRDVSKLSLGCYVQVAVSSNGDRTQARESIRALAVAFMRFSGYEGGAVHADVAGGDQEQFLRAARAMEDTFRPGDPGRQGERGAVTKRKFDPTPDPKAVDDDFIDRFAIVGPPELCAERLREVMALGFDRIYIGTRFMSVDVDEVNTERVGREVLPRLR